MSTEPLLPLKEKKVFKIGNLAQKKNVTIEGTTYYVYNNGTSTHINGTTIIVNGGVDALNEHLNVKQNTTEEEMPTSVITINGEKYYIYEDGKVTFENKTTFIKEGGEKALRDLLEVV